MAAEDLIEKIELGLAHFAHPSLHQGLDGATPSEIYFGRPPDGPMKPARKIGRLSAHPRANAEAKSPAAYPPTMMLCTGENIGVGG